jgi:hypothetical protein
MLRTFAGNIRNVRSLVAIGALPKARRRLKHQMFPVKFGLVCCILSRGMYARDAW